MNHDDAREHDERVRALQRDADAVVPPQAERDLLSTFRAHHALGVLRDDEDAAVPPRVEARLLTAFREHHARESGAAVVVRGFAWSAPRAAVLIAAIAGATWFALPQPVRNTDAPPAELAQNDPKPALVAEAGRPTKRQATGTRSGVATAPSLLTSAPHAPLPGRAVMAANLEAPAPTLNDDQGDGDFMPLMDVDLPAGEPTHIVSVDVPRSALLDFGAQPDATPDDATAVHAEVLMSEDGMPRGIRFVERGPAPLTGSSGSQRAPLPSRRRLQP